MDLQSLSEHLDQMPMFPYFTICHMIVCTLNTRADLGSGSLYFSRKHPFACWLSTILCIFSSTILANFLLNEPVISIFGNTQQVLWASSIWYLIFYSPFDVINRIFNFMPVKIVLYCMYEVHNCKTIYLGIVHTSKIFPDSYVIMAFIGIVKGNGPGFMRMLERLIRGSWSLNVLEFLHPTYATKVSAFATIVFITNRYCELLMISQPFVFFCVALACLYFRLSTLVLDVSDPFSPLESMICLLLFGGIWDALARALTMEKQFQYSQFKNLKTKAQRADTLSRSGRLIVEKPHIMTAQSA